MLFSVLMANYNNARFLDASIRSVFEQTYSNWELVIVDDGSTDDFETVISAYTHDRRIRIYRNGTNQGTATTKAICAELAKGAIAGFLDPDDLITPETIQIMIDAHLATPAASIVHSTNYICDSNLTVLKISECPKPLPEEIPYLLIGDGSIHHFVSFKVQLYHQSAKLEKTRDHDRASDQELYYLLEEQGGVVFINQPLHYYRIHTGSISNMGNEGKTLNQHYLIIQKACLRRIGQLEANADPVQKPMIKLYKTRYRKIRTLYSFRKHMWWEFSKNLFLFSVGGGFANIRSYIRKLPKEGIGMISRSFNGNYNAIK